MFSAFFFFFFFFLQNSVKERTTQLVNQLLQGIAGSNLRHMQRICSSFEQIGAKLVREPTDAAELRRLAEYSETCVSILYYSLAKNIVDEKKIRKKHFFVVV